jgi:hypothetical protein
VVTHVICLEQVKMVTMKNHFPHALHEVVIDTTKDKWRHKWNPTFIKFKFQSEEAATAFQLALTDHISN